VSKFFSHRILHHKSKSTSHIPQLELPEETRKSMGFLNKKATKYLRSFDFETDEFDTIHLGVLSKYEEILFAHISWYFRSVEVIESLNIILADLSLFCKSPYLFDGSMFDRTQLLVRTYFNEFYRSRDSWQRYIQKVKRLGAISDEDVKNARNDYKQLHGNAIKMRNNLLHAFTTSGEPMDNLWITLIETAIDQGGYIVDKKTKELITVEGHLNNYLTKTLPPLVNIGMELRNDIQERLEIWNLFFIEQQGGAATPAAKPSQPTSFR